jgi:hypothetical protein
LDFVAVQDLASRAVAQKLARMLHFVFRVRSSWRI